MISRILKISPKLTAKKYVLAIDQGTTGTRVFIFNARGRVVASAYQEIKQYFPKPGWVEHCPVEIWDSVCSVIAKSLRKASLKPPDIAAVGITNQRETTVVWDAISDKPYHRAIVWQDRRTAEHTESLKKRGLEIELRARTGLVADPYFSASKLTWLLAHVPALQRGVKTGRARFGTIDSWLLWKLTGGTVHATDYTNASRTLLFNIRRRVWDKRLLKLFKVPLAMLPEVKDSGSLFGSTAAGGPLAAGIPIAGILGDQQAALYGQSCYGPGDVKNTFGTGAFLMMNVGPKYLPPPHGLLTTLACDKHGKSVYAFEGAIFIAGAVMQWLRDGLRILDQSAQSAGIAASIKDSGGVLLVPAFAGLGSPYWEPRVRGAILGLSRGTGRAQIVRAALEAIAHQTADGVTAMQQSAGCRMKALRADGGASLNPFLMQTTADYLQKPVLAADFSDLTAWGAAKLAGYTIGLWSNPARLDQSQKYRLFKPQRSASVVRSERQRWKAAVSFLISSAGSF
jgi:glycerol kinase